MGEEKYPYSFVLFPTSLFQPSALALSTDLLEEEIHFCGEVKAGYLYTYKVSDCR